MPIRKSPLSYMGGKGRLVVYLSQFFNFASIAEYREPFIGGGSMFFYIRQKYPALRTWINDLNPPLIAFYTALRDDCSLLQKRCSALVDIEESKARELFYDVRPKLYTGELSPIDTATYYIFVSKSGYGGQESNTFNYPNYTSFSVSAINLFSRFSTLLQGTKITISDYSSLLSTDKSILYYFDPPYLQREVKRGYYGKGGMLHLDFNHTAFRDSLADIVNPFISYNNIPEIRGLYEGYKMERFAVKYQIRGCHCKQANIKVELLIHK